MTDRMTEENEVIERLRDIALNDGSLTSYSREYVLKAYDELIKLKDERDRLSLRLKEAESPIGQFAISASHIFMQEEIARLKRKREEINWERYVLFKIATRYAAQLLDCDIASAQEHVRAALIFEESDPTEKKSEK